MRSLALLAIVLISAGCGQSVPNKTQAAPTVDDGVSEAAVTGTVAPARVSQYSPIDDKACRTIEESEETGDWTGLCPGVAGYQVEWSIGDLRDDLIIINGKARTQLSIPSLVANGAFDSLGAKAEWRGPAGQRPDVLVVRVHVANAEGKSDSGRLAIARLTPRPCLVAIVPPELGQSDRARTIADGKLPDCLEK
jgi:hypothetical protein